jgi:hypothetical protein
VAQNSGDFNNLAAGIYSIGVADINGCDTVISNVTVMAEDFSFEAKVIKDSLCEGNSGSIELDVISGNPPYSYKLDNGSFTDLNVFNSICQGDHTITIRDNVDCIVSLHVTVPRGDTGIRWSTDIRPLVETYCSLSGCHNGTSRPDLRQYDKAKYYAADMKTMTQDRSMPFDGIPLQQHQIDIIACWVDDGAPNN